MCIGKSLFFLLFASPGFAGENATPGLTVSGDFCEIIWVGEKWERVSCFALSHGPDGFQLEGTAYSWARNRGGVVVAPRLASW